MSTLSYLFSFFFLTFELTMDVVPGHARARREPFGQEESWFDGVKREKNYYIGKHEGCCLAYVTVLSFVLIP